MPARSATDIRTLKGSDVPASHVFAPFAFVRAIGTRFHTPTPSTWYSSTSERRSRYWSFASQRTVAALPRRFSGSTTSDGGLVSMTIFILGSTNVSRAGETLPSVRRTCMVNQYSPSLLARNEKAV